MGKGVLEYSTHVYTDFASLRGKPAIGNDFNIEESCKSQQNPSFFLLLSCSIADAPHITILPVVTKDLPISPRLTPHVFFKIAMQAQQSYNSSTNG